MRHATIPVTKHPADSPRNFGHSAPRGARSVVIAFFLMMASAGGLLAAGGEDPVPYLRLNIPGHTARVTQLAFSPDSQTLYSAGLDKVVHQWARANEASGPWNHQGVYRWDVKHGYSGLVWAMGVDPLNGRIAIGGTGSGGKRGETVWFEPGRFHDYASWRFPVDAPRGTPQHEMVVTALEFSPAGGWFASADLTGKVLLWPGAAKQPSGELAPPYTQVYGSDEARWRDKTAMVGTRPVCFCGENMLVLPRFLKLGQSGKYRYSTWGLMRAMLSMQNNRPQVQLQALPGEYFDMVTSLSGSRDGRVLAAAEPRKVVLYQFTDDGRVRPTTELPAAYAMVRGLSLSPDGALLAVAGTRRLGSEEAPQLAERIELWDTSDPSKAELVWSQDTQQQVTTCRISPDAQQLAYSTESQVHVAPIAEHAQRDAPARRVVFTMPGVHPVDAVGFVEPADPLGSDKPGQYALYVARGDNRRVFQLHKPDVVVLEDDAQPPRLFATEGRFPNLKLQMEANSLQVTSGNLVITTLPLNPSEYGEITSSHWIGEQRGRPRRLAIGMHSGAILIYSLPTPTTAGGRLLRQFVAHQDQVTRLALSPDGRYLASGGADGVAAIWPLGDLDAAADSDAAMHAWGVTLESAPNGTAVIKSIDARGPLFTSGVELGDTITALRVERQSRVQRVSGFESIRRTLRTMQPSVDQPVILFELRTAKGEDRQVQATPSWGPLLSLYSYADQWIAWTPNGYYESSLAGDALLGWQLNHALGEAPSFYTAEQFLNQMWRPELIRRLLSEGSIKQAAAEAKAGPVKLVELDEVPTVTVQAPAETEEKTIQVVVWVQASESVESTEVRLELNGVPFQRSYVSQLGSFNLPFTLSADDERFADQENLNLTATVCSSSGNGKTPAPKLVRWTSPRTAPPPDEATLYVLAIGVSDYTNLVLDDGKTLNPLPKASVDADRIAELLQSRHAYDAAHVTLLNTSRQTTRQAIKQQLREMMQQPIDGNDTVVLYYAGHSIVENDELLLIPSDGLSGKLKASELLRDFCLGPDGAASLGRRVVIFDSCHSGALVGLDMSSRSPNEFSRIPEHVAKRMKSQMWDTGLLLSCQAGESSRSLPGEDEGGVFTTAILEGLKGFARSADPALRDIDLGALENYLRRKVRMASKSMQIPVTLVPDDLLDCKLTKI